eukprot:scaffold568_cov376-Prasinococcus_capsulatus_cf.AAC.16
MYSCCSRVHASVLGSSPGVTWKPARREVVAGAAALGEAERSWEVNLVPVASSSTLDWHRYAAAGKVRERPAAPPSLPPLGSFGSFAGRADGRTSPRAVAGEGRNPARSPFDRTPEPLQTLARRGPWSSHKYPRASHSRPQTVPLPRCKSMRRGPTSSRGHNKACCNCHGSSGTRRPPVGC